MLCLMLLTIWIIMQWPQSKTLWCLQQVCGRLWSSLQVAEHLCGWQKLLVRQHSGWTSVYPVPDFMAGVQMKCGYKLTSGFVCCLQVLLCGTVLCHTRCLRACCCHPVHIYPALFGPEQPPDRPTVWQWVTAILSFFFLSDLIEGTVNCWLHH